MPMLRATATSLGVVACACLLGCGGARTSGAASVQTTRAAPSTTTTRPVTTVATAPAPRPRPHPRPPTPMPGRLPQTDQLPSAHTPAFDGEMKALWRAVRTDSVKSGLPAFFPEAAYDQVKAIGDPAADWQYRLLEDYRLDLDAAHALLGAHAGEATLLGVQVPGSYAHWIPPNVCYNGVGYYELPNARVIYREDGEESSFGIASMISWRGVWYVIHLGAVTRDAAVGMVDDPSPGTGTSAPSSTC